VQTMNCVLPNLAWLHQRSPVWADIVQLENRPPRLLGMAWVAWLALSGLLRAQELNFTAVRAEVDFSQHLQPWDGFGFNYVETAQTRNYDRTPQDYGGFSLLREEDCQKILHMVFGDDGLKVTILKMFLDPWHQREPGGPYDHETTTRWMRYFAREGLKIARASGANSSS